MNKNHIQTSEKAKKLSSSVEVEECGKLSHTKQDILEGDLDSSIVNVMGVLMQVCDEPQTAREDTQVRYGSRVLFEKNQGIFIS